MDNIDNTNSVLFTIVEVRRESDIARVNRALQEGWKLIAFEKSVNEPYLEETIYYHLGWPQSV